MISSHFNLNHKQQRLRLVLVVLALLAAIVAARSVWAQDDTPITISDGSLTIESSGFAWTNWGSSGPKKKTHPRPGKSVTQVDITLNGVAQPSLAFSGQQCTVDVTYVGTNVNVDTAANGRNLSVTTDFDTAFGTATANQMAHNNPNGKISRVTVRRGGTVVFNQPATAHTKVVIHYQ